MEKKIVYKKKIKVYKKKNNIHKLNKYINKYNQIGGDNIFVYNKISRNIQRVDDVFLEYKMIDLPILRYYAYLNYYSIINELENKKAMDKYIHISMCPIGDIGTINENTSWVGDGIYHNPRGLWFSYGTDWIKWVTDNGKKIYLNQWTLGTYLYEVTINKSVLKISNLTEFKQFISEYIKKDAVITDVIDWDKVKNDYNGIIICPFLGKDIWGDNYNYYIYGDKKSIQENYDKLIGDKWKDDIRLLAEWYKHWETGTGVCWNKNGITEITLLNKLNTFANIDLI